MTIPVFCAPKSAMISMILWAVAYGIISGMGCVCIPKIEHYASFVRKLLLAAYMVK